MPAINNAVLFLAWFLLLAQVPLASETPNLNEQEAERFANIELHDENSVREAALQYLSLLLKIESLPDSAETRALKGSGRFFLRFQLSRSPDVEYISLDDKMYLRMPKYDTNFKNVMLESMKHVYQDVAQRWRAIGFTPPEGFVYVWIFSEVEQMKQEFGVEESTRAFALPCRFLVVPYAIIPYRDYLKLQKDALARRDDPSAVRQRLDEFLQKDFKKSFAHELTHVFVNSTVGLKGSKELDKWFHEAFAIWMSQDDEKLLAAEYKDYKSLFDFIKMKFGNERFLSFVQRAIREKSVDQSIQENLGMASQSDLRQQAARWHANLRLLVIVLTMLAIGIVIVCFNRLMKNKSFLWGGLVIISLFSLLTWWFGTLNVYTDSISGSEKLNYVAIVLVLLTPVWKAGNLYNLSILRKRIGRANESIHLAVEAEANFYSPSEFKTAKGLLAEARKYESQGRPRKGISYATKAVQAANDSIARIPDNKRRKLRELKTSYDQARREVLAWDREIDATRTFNQHLGIDPLLLQLYEAKIDQLVLQLNSCKEKLAQVETHLEEGNLAKAQTEIKNLETILSQLR